MDAINHSTVTTHEYLGTGLYVKKDAPIEEPIYILVRGRLVYETLLNAKSGLQPVLETFQEQTNLSSIK